MHHYVTEGYLLPNQAQIYWTAMIVLYPYVTGIVAGAFIVSALHHVFYVKALAPVSRFSLMLALAFMLCAPLPLLAHLGHPERALNIVYTPNITSAMAGFGFIYNIYLAILLVEIWLVYREDIIFLSHRARTAVMRRFYWLLALGVTDNAEAGRALDKKVMLLLSAIGIPAACLLHGYVGFLFGAIKANPWWASPLMPVIFLTSAVVSGVVMVLVAYLALQWITRRPVDDECAYFLMRLAWICLMVGVSLEILELMNHAYMANHDWDIMRLLITEKLRFSMLILQFLVGSLVPFLLLGASVTFKERISPRVRQLLGFVSGVLMLVQVAAMRWNVVIGGQMYSKSFRGFLDFDIDLYGREGLIAVLVLFSIPFIALFVFSRIVPLWGPVSTFPTKWLRPQAPGKEG